MNPLVKKEIRLLLPAWSVAMLLALVQAITRPYDFYVAALLFLGMTMMALTAIGRETSLNTFSFMLAQPVERIRYWQAKLSVLAVAFLTVFGVWLLAFGFAFWNSTVATSEAENSRNLLIFITVCLIATATFTGGLWTTLLLRQQAAAFWLTLLVPATLCCFTAAFVSPNESDNGVIAVLCVILGIYSIGGFLVARWLFFRAQDVGWSGGIIALPEWRSLSARSITTGEIRKRKPIVALVKKEFQLQQAVLAGAAGLLVLHLGIIALRKYHQFPRNSAGEILTSIFWMLWLVMPVILGSIAVAEERKQGVMECQLCLPASRQVQFAIKAFITLFLGILLGGVMPVLLETAAVKMGWANNAFAENGAFGPVEMRLAIVGIAAWLVLGGFFASSLARNFLQAIGFAMATFIGSALMVPALAKGWNFFFESLPLGSILSLIIAVPTLAVTLLLLAYLNFKNFRDGWHLWRRNLLVVAGAMFFVVASSMAIYNRAWEIFKPAEPVHGAAKLSLANSPALQIAHYWNLLVRLPDGRVWFNGLGDSPYEYYGGSVRWKLLWRMLTHPLPESVGPQQFLAGSNWVAATTEHLYFRWNDAGKTFYASDFMETVGIQPDGTLWISEKSETNKWTPGTLQQFGSETNWRQLAQGNTSVVLLKTDGTLWRWGSVTNELHHWPGLRAFTPYQIGTNSDWQELFTLGGIFARRMDGRVWQLSVDWKTGRDELNRATNYDEIVSRTASRAGAQTTAFVRADGTLWVLNRYWDKKSNQTMGTGILQVGKENDWRAVAVSYQMMVALKSDGSLWQWNFKNESAVESVNMSPTRLGIHNDWVAITGTWRNVITLAADGSMWLWPDKKSYDYYQVLIKLPKQPEFLGNVFGKAN